MINNHVVLLFVEPHFIEDGKFVRWPRKCFLFECGNKERATVISTMNGIVDKFRALTLETEGDCTVALFIQGEVRPITDTNGVKGRIVKASDEKLFQFKCQDIETGFARMRHIFERLQKWVDNVDEE